MAQVGRRAGAPGMRGVLVVGIAGAIVLAIAGMALMRPSGIEIERRPDGAAATSVTAASATTDGARAEGSAVAATAAEPSAARVLVHVDGAVRAPGVYELAGESSRGKDAVEAAGGLTEDADTSTLNLARQLADGDKLSVPRVGEASRVEDAVAPASGSAEARAASGAADAGLVNINTATAAELDALPGVGPSTAAAIVEDRTTNGPFASVDDLMRVSGIGEKKFAKLKGQIRV